MHFYFCVPLLLYSYSIFYLLTIYFYRQNYVKFYIIISYYYQQYIIKNYNRTSTPFSPSLLLIYKEVKKNRLKLISHPTPTNLSLKPSALFFPLIMHNFREVRPDAPGPLTLTYFGPRPSRFADLPRTREKITACRASWILHR